MGAGGENVELRVGAGGANVELRVGAGGANVELRVGAGGEMWILRVGAGGEMWGKWRVGLFWSLCFFYSHCDTYFVEPVSVFLFSNMIQRFIV